MRFTLRANDVIRAPCSTWDQVVFVPPSSPPLPAGSAQLRHISSFAMFTRVLSKPFFLKRGSQSDPATKPAKDTEASAEGHGQSRVLQPTADNNGGNHKGGAGTEVRNVSPLMQVEDT